MVKSIPQFELKKIQSQFPAIKIRSSEDAYKFCRQFYGDDIEIYESFFLLLMNRSNTTIGFAKISQGGITGTVVDPRIVAKYAVESLATGVILCHNHPSGNLDPSPQDKDYTQKIKAALKFLDIQVFDHLILSSESFFSFADDGIL